MKTGDKVYYRGAAEPNLTGEVESIQGKKWLKVRSADGVILAEHINDIATLDSKQKR